ncbi:hypothetical protein HK100_005677 [Physocladia obscura]|uniref:Uncharacterized protein n=1 Tax=Physocladia obscura TaxID=109957 RepID=A0AAD5SRC7_9FUNG|nr:hypothetical protein HK100_005677 [Physocladia obscura]
MFVGKFISLRNVKFYANKFTFGWKHANGTRPTDEEVRKYHLELENLFKELDKPVEYKSNQVTESYEMQSDTSEEEMDLGFDSQEESDIEEDDDLDVEGLAEVIRMYGEKENLLKKSRQQERMGLNLKDKLIKRGNQNHGSKSMCKSVLN